MFEKKFNEFLEKQRESASVLRLEQLRKDLTGERKLIKEVLYPVLGSFDGLFMEAELVSSSGVKIFVDVLFDPLRFAFESEGFGAHAENITRDRFTFERMRVRTMVMQGYKYLPFTWDELDKKPDACRRVFYELLGRFSSTAGIAHYELTVYEREVLRYMVRLNRSLRLEDACYCLQMRPQATRHVLLKLVEKNLIRPLNKGALRFHEYVVEKKAADYML